MNQAREGVLNPTVKDDSKHFDNRRTGSGFSKDDFVIRLIGYWFISLMFFNDKTNYWNLKYIINFRPDRIIFIFTLIMFYLKVSPYNKKKYIFPEYMMLLFFSICTVSSIIAGTIYHPLNAHVSTIINFIGFPMIIFMMARRLDFNDISIEKMAHVFILIGLYLGITGILEHFNMNWLVFPNYIMDESIGIHFGRARGPFVHAAVFGSVLCMIFSLTIYYMMNVNNGLIYILASFAMLTSIYFSYTRSGWIQLACSVVVFLFFKSKIRKIAFIFIIGIAIIYMSGIFNKFSVYSDTLFSRRDNPVYDRINIINTEINMIKDKPILGWGYGTYEKYNDDYFVEIKGVEMRGEGEGNHNVLLGTFVETGIAGLFPYVLIFYSFWRNSYRLHTDNKGIRKKYSDFGIMNVGIIFGYFVAVQLYDPRFFAFLNSMMFLTSGIVYSLLEKSKMEEIKSPELTL